MKKAISYRLSAISRMGALAGMLVPAGCQQINSNPRQTDGADQPLHMRIQETFVLSDAENWLFRTPELWSVAEESDRRYLRMSEPPQRPMLPGVRRPQEYAIYAPHEFRSFSLSCFVRVERDTAVKARDACIIFGRQDDTHYYYVHLAGVSDGVHNTLMRVDGDTRKRLVPEDYRPTPVFTDREWHKVDVLRNADTGLIQIYVNAYDPATATPYFEVIDKTYEWGHLAIGSFDDFASFSGILIEGQARKPASPPNADRGEE